MLANVDMRDLRPFSRLIKTAEVGEGGIRGGFCKKNVKPVRANLVRTTTAGQGVVREYLCIRLGAFNAQVCFYLLVYMYL